MWDAFNDPLVDNKDILKKRYRADVLIEDHINAKLEDKINKRSRERSQKFGDALMK